VPWDHVAPFTRRAQTLRLAAIFDRLVDP
jgi:hypothetical protein